jgi:ADP-ribosylglycohydrolase
MVTADSSKAGNSSAMRVSPVGFAFDTIETVLREAALDNRWNVSEINNNLWSFRH